MRRHGVCRSSVWAAPVVSGARTCSRACCRATRRPRVDGDGRVVYAGFQARASDKERHHRRVAVCRRRGSCGRQQRDGWGLDRDDRGFHGSTCGRGRSTSWDGGSTIPASAWCSRVRCRTSSRSITVRCSASACERLAFAQPPGRAVCHPGGRRVIEAIETMLYVPRESLEHERSVMRDFGNMSGADGVLRPRTRARRRVTATGYVGGARSRIYGELRRAGYAWWLTASPYWSSSQRSACTNYRWPIATPERLLAAGAYEYRSRPLPGDGGPACWLALTLWIFGWNWPLYCRSWPYSCCCKPGARGCSARWARADDPHHHSSRRTASHERAISLPAASELRHRGAGTAVRLARAPGLWVHALIFGVLNLAMLAWRVWVEAKALHA